MILEREKGTRVVEWSSHMCSSFPSSFLSSVVALYLMAKTLTSVQNGANPIQFYIASFLRTRVYIINSSEKRLFNRDLFLSSRKERERERCFLVRVLERERAKNGSDDDPFSR